MSVKKEMDLTDDEVIALLRKAEGKALGELNDIQLQLLAEDGNQAALEELQGRIMENLNEKQKGQIKKLRDENKTLKAEKAAQETKLETEADIQLKNKVMAGDYKAFNELLDKRGLSQDTFFDGGTNNHVAEEFQRRGLEALKVSQKKEGSKTEEVAGEVKPGSFADSVNSLRTSLKNEQA